MTLYTDQLLADLRALPGADHCFLKQLAAADGQADRAWLDTAVAQVGGAVADRWADVLGSLDNRRFFQGWSEVAASRLLVERGWRVTDLAWPGPCLAARDPEGRPYNVMVLGFVKQVRAADRRAIARLVRAVDRIGSRSRIAVLIRRWLPHDFDPEPVRRAIELWLREVDRSGWEGRYAEYRDEHVSLEFALTGETAGPGQGVVALTLGPYDAHRVLASVEQRLVYELDAYRLSAWSDQPVVVVCVANQPWSLPAGYLRELLYGKPEQQATQPWEPRYTATFGVEMTPSLFRDSLYATLAGLVLVERQPGQPAPTAPASFVNPWAHHALSPDALPGRVFAEHRRDGERRVMAWVDKAG